MKQKLRNLYYKLLENLTTKTIDDEFLSWLGFANAGMLNNGNIYCMDYAIRNIPSENPILEIGSFCGLSTNVLAYFLLKHNKNNQVITCDKWVFEGKTEGKIGQSRITHSEYKDFVKSTFIRNVGFFSPDKKPYTIELFSDEFFNLWQKKESTLDVFDREIRLGGKFSFCYIDGNHTYEYAKRDFENTDKNLDVGGHILFDDSSDRDVFGLKKLMHEIKKNSRYELVMKNPNYLFKKVA